jgi:hypothetical protein
MKKLFILFYLPLVVLSAPAFAQDKKVAVVTFYADKQIDISRFAAKSAEASITKLCNDPDFDMMPFLKNFHDQFFKNYAKKFNFQLLPEREVIGDSNYKDFTPNDPASAGALRDELTLAAKGYKVVLPLKDNENEKKLASMFATCDGIMKVYLDFGMEKKGLGGVALVKVNANLHILLFDKSGKKVFSTIETAMSQISGSEVHGIPFLTPKRVLPLCENAVDELMIKLQQDMPKIAEKADGKL